MADVIDAVRAGTKQVLHEQHEEMRNIVRGLSAEALNWTPGAETNSICVLVSHALDAERFLTSSAANIDVDRDRERHFRSHVESDSELLELIDRMEPEIDGYLEQLRAEHLGMQIARPNRTFTGMWWLLHAVEHSREHIGQAFLTRQLFEQRG